MSATTFRNLIHRREHQERAQPEARERYGLLEKHKDYVQRAKNYHSKEKRILALRRRAADRNPDEFNPKMHSMKTKGGVHVAEGVRPTFTADELKLLKTQDRGYIQTIKNMETRKVERLRATLHGIDGKTADEEDKPIKHLVFVDTVEDVATTAAAAEESSEAKSAPVTGKRARREMSQAYAELHEREQRATKMARLLTQMDMERELMKKGRRMKVADATEESGAVFKWKAERKK